MIFPISKAPKSGNFLRSKLSQNILSKKNNTLLLSSAVISPLPRTSTYGLQGQIKACRNSNHHFMQATHFKISTALLNACQSPLTKDIQSRLQAIKQLHETVHHEKKQTLLKMFAQACLDTDQLIFIYPFKKIKLESIPYKKAKNKIQSYLKYQPVNLKKLFIQTLEHANWSVFQSDIFLPTGKRYQNYALPTADFHLKTKAQDKEVLHPLFKRPLKQGQGLSCYSNQSDMQHSHNLWISQLKDQDRILFSGLRHASLSSVNLSKINRQTGSNNKAEELIRAALFAKHEHAILSAIETQTPPSTPLKLKLTSTSLLSLFNLNFLTIHEVEKRQFNDQMSALQRLAKETTDIELGGVRIPVEIKFLQFNTGVNNVAMNQGKTVGLFHKKHWSRADRVNQSSLESFLGFAFLHSHHPDVKPDGWVGEYLKTLGESETLKAQKILTLAHEIKTIFNQKCHHTEDNGRYKLGKRIAYLSFLIDAVPAYNCKSGKDRTGLMDVEIKALAAKLDEAVVNQPIDTQVSKESRQLFYLDPVNFKIQQLNSGTSGNKVMNSNSLWLKEQLGDAVYQAVKGNANDGY